MHDQTINFLDPFVMFIRRCILTNELPTGVYYALYLACVVKTIQMPKSLESATNYRHFGVYIRKFGIKTTLSLLNVNFI